MSIESTEDYDDDASLNLTDVVALVALACFLALFAYWWK